MTASMVEQIDKNLARYYKLCNRDGYVNADGIGKFREYCEENGFEDDAMLEQIEGKIDECCLLEFDEDFPFLDNSAHQDKPAKIMEILRKCREEENAQFAVKEYEPFDVLPEHWHLQQQDLTDTKKLYSTHLHSVLRSEHLEIDLSLLKVLSIGQKLKRNYLGYLRDMYLRDRARIHAQNRRNNHGDTKALSVAQWAANNPYMQQLKSATYPANTFESARTAIQTSLTRVSKEISLNPQIQIHDSLEDVYCCVEAMVNFVRSLVVKKELICPFQCDQCIIFDKVSSKATDEKEDDDHEDDEVELENNSETKPQPKPKHEEEKKESTDSDSACDVVGDLKKRLEDEELLYTASVLDAVRFAIRLHETWKPFKQKMREEKYDAFKHNGEYPRRKRVITIIDRRGTSEDDPERPYLNTQGHELYFINPPSSCATLPDIHLPEWYFDASCTCILPAMKRQNKAKNGGNDEEDEEEEEEEENEMYHKVINAGSPCRGTLMVLSFHVEAEDEIRCYLYLQGRVTRFVPMDLLDVLPLYFKMNQENKKFLQSSKPQEYIQAMQKKLKDDAFEAFYKQYSNVV